MPHDVQHGLFQCVTAGSKYEMFGGHRSLWDRSLFRERQPESQKKSARRLQHFCNCVDYNFCNGMTEEQVFVLPQDTFKTANKKEITLSGTEVVLKKGFVGMGKKSSLDDFNNGLRKRNPCTMRKTMQQ